MTVVMATQLKCEIFSIYLHYGTEVPNRSAGYRPGMAKGHLGRRRVPVFWDHTHFRRMLVARHMAKSRRNTSPGIGYALPNAQHLCIPKTRRKYLVQLESNEEKKYLIIFYTDTLWWANQQFPSAFNEHCEILSETQKLLEACSWLAAISRIIDQWTEAERASIQRAADWSFQSPG